MELGLINEISTALGGYRAAIALTLDPQAKEDYLRLATIVEDVLSAMKTEDVDRIKLGVLGFSRQVSDSLSTQPPEFKALAQKIAEAKRRAV
ncbi:hypothetical protein ED236_12255 [Pseudomethylobacillus aquaticus]|uniref:Uncharacterized protein n=1 Tax=Pseudomethylobacillus aquaticus TaxID=2676064 RepID=A0A3N0UT93_9PROT|nr:hypothetical protein [Pseudomethylobacillus aquaticus]ROH83779.1 hypothetical protein ED236_12255 [Pseudomethylobacillus aquaticus]